MRTITKRYKALRMVVSAVLLVLAASSLCTAAVPEEEAKEMIQQSGVDSIACIKLSTELTSWMLDVNIVGDISKSQMDESSDLHIESYLLYIRVANRFDNLVDNFTLETTQDLRIFKVISSTLTQANHLMNAYNVAKQIIDYVKTNGAALSGDEVRLRMELVTVYLALSSNASELASIHRYGVSSYRLLQQT